MNFVQPFDLDHNRSTGGLPFDGDNLLVTPKTLERIRQKFVK